MKIVTWNVNGIRALINKGAWEQFQELDADVICLQEIKAREDQLSETQLVSLDGYHAIWNPAQRPGYSGVLTLTRHQFESHQLGISADDDDEGRAIRLDMSNISLFNLYVPNGRRDHSRVKFKLDYYRNLLETCDMMKLEGRDVIICGDLNTAHNEIDLTNPKPNKNATGFLKSERDWISKFIDHGYVDIFRLSNPEKVEYTWWTYRNNARQRNIGWRLDYFLISESLISNVNDLTIHKEIAGSDHCPVSIVLDV